jgi:hypothetical protein
MTNNIIDISLMVSEFRGLVFTYNHWLIQKNSIVTADRRAKLHNTHFHRESLFQISGLLSLQTDINMLTIGLRLQLFCLISTVSYPDNGR